MLQQPRRIDELSNLSVDIKRRWTDTRNGRVISTLSKLAGMNRKFDASPAECQQATC